jgi:dihydroorotase
MPMYTEFFCANDKLHLLEGFASHFGADFYEQPRNNSKLTLIKKSQKIPPQLDLGQQTVKPIAASQTIQWTTA